MSLSQEGKINTVPCRADPTVFINDMHCFILTTEVIGSQINLGEISFMDCVSFKTWHASFMHRTPLVTMNILKGKEYILYVYPSKTAILCVY